MSDDREVGKCLACGGHVESNRVDYCASCVEKWYHETVAIRNQIKKTKKHTCEIDGTREHKTWNDSLCWENVRLSGTSMKIDGIGHYFNIGDKVGGYVVLGPAFAIRVEDVPGRRSPRLNGRTCWCVVAKCGCGAVNVVQVAHLKYKRNMHGCCRCAMRELNKNRKAQSRIPVGYYVYAWIDGRDVVYIGKGEGKRAWRAESKKYKVKILAARMSSDDAEKLEKATIRLLVAMGKPLLNVTYTAPQLWDMCESECA